VNKAHVRIVTPQQEETSSTIIVGSEADALLRKYHLEQQQKQIDEYDDNFRGFKDIEVPKPIDSRVDADENGMYSNTSWDNELGISMEIKINSTIPLPK